LMRWWRQGRQDGRLKWERDGINLDGLNHASRKIDEAEGRQQQWLCDQQQWRQREIGNAAMWRRQEKRGWRLSPMVGGVGGGGERRWCRGLVDSQVFSEITTNLLIFKYFVHF
jgi:hypothetical protein